MQEYEALSDDELEILTLAARDMEPHSFRIDKREGDAIFDLMCLPNEQYVEVVKALEFVRTHRDKGFTEVCLYRDAERFYVFATNRPANKGREIFVPMTENLKGGLDLAIANHASNNLQPWDWSGNWHEMRPQYIVLPLFMVWMSLWMFFSNSLLLQGVGVILVGLAAWYHYLGGVRAHDEHQQKHRRLEQQILAIRNEPNTHDPPRLHLAMS